MCVFKNDFFFVFIKKINIFAYKIYIDIYNAIEDIQDSYTQRVWERERESNRRHG